MGVLGRLLPLSFVPLLVLAASDPFVDGLNQLGLTSFAKLILAISQTKLGATLVQQLMTSTNYSIFVPTNEALAELDSNSTQDTNLVAAIASYHVIEGNYYRDHSDDKSLSAEVFPNVTIARTLLTDSGFVQLENGLGQVLIWGKDKDGSTKILNQPRETTVQSANLVVGYAVFPVNHVLQSPAWLSITLKNRTQGTTNALVTALQSTFVDIPDGKNKSLLTLFDDPGHFHGYTFLAPTDEAFAKVADVLPKLSADEVRNILLNHVINGTTLYSTTLAPGKAITGQETTFLANATGAYVTSGSVTAKITQTNALVRDGVVHTIDTVLTDVPKKGSGGGGSDGGSGKCKPKR